MNYRVAGSQRSVLNEAFVYLRDNWPYGGEVSLAGELTSRPSVIVREVHRDLWSSSSGLVFLAVASVFTAGVAFVAYLAYQQFKGDPIILAIVTVVDEDKGICTVETDGVEAKMQDFLHNWAKEKAI